MITFSFSHRDYAKIIFVVLVAVFVVASVAHIAIDTYDNAQNNEVYEQLDKKGGIIYLSETTGSGASSLVRLYVPIESGVKVLGEYVHLDKAKNYYTDTYTLNLYVPMNAILYISIN